VTHCVPFWKAEEKAAQIAGIKAFTELPGQLFRQRLQLAFAIGSASMPLLFMFDNEPAHVPVTLDHRSVNDPCTWCWDCWIMAAISLKSGANSWATDGWALEDIM
jgi:hypothetical protein